jgi:signal transduction histidine kinase
VRRILDVGARAHGIVRRLLTFARREPVAPRTVDLGQALQEAAPLLHQLAGTDLRLVLRPAGGTVFMDPSQLEQLFSILTVRARDAMPRGGTLTLEVEAVNLPPAADSAGGPHVRLSATDTAPAMNPDARRAAFDAFAVSEEGATGLALATCEAIAAQAGGRISLVSAGATGNTILVDLPRAAPI